MRNVKNLIPRSMRQFVCEPIKHVVSPIARNEKCPCGSGKKFKRCHLLVDPAAPPKPAKKD